MAYIPLSLDAGTPSAVAWLIRNMMESLYLSDVHAMLRLPLPALGIGAGQNFAATQVLMCVISGASTLLYDNTLESGDAFKGVVEDFFPWDEEPGAKRPRKASAGILYDVFRNPLIHNAGLSMVRRHGVYYPVRKKYQVKVKRLLPKGSDSGHAEAWIEALERSPSLPTMGATLTTASDRKVLHLEGLYWGTRKMLEKLSANPERMARANRILAPHLTAASRPTRARAARAADAGR